jgi:hypothetical protein
MDKSIVLDPATELDPHYDVIVIGAVQAEARLPVGWGNWANVFWSSSVAVL